MTAAELSKILRSEEFESGLREISCFAASITQERPIVHLLAKCLWKQKRLFALERVKRQDLAVWESSVASRVDPTGIEFKFNFETGIRQLENELARHGGDIDKASKDRSSDRRCLPRIARDITEKVPDVFVWVICHRDLRGMTGSRETICGWVRHQRYCKRPFCADRDILEPAERVLRFYGLAPSHVTIPFRAADRVVFPSTYHFLICEPKRR